MACENTIAKLELLKELIDQYDPIKYSSSDESKKLYENICLAYGEIADIYQKIAGPQKVEVPVSGGRRSYYANYFEAGYLSGRTFYSHQGKSELLMVIGKVKSGLSVPTDKSISLPLSNNRVFLVHGHNEAVMHASARFIEGLGLQAIILREQPNQGRTIIEKFVDYSDVAFAVILLTADDRGGPAAHMYDDQKKRARQNVILEMGFFLGKLGRDRVCALYEEGVEVPSDYHGVLFIPIDDSQDWRLLLAKEMKAAGLSIDLNKAI